MASLAFHRLLLLSTRPHAQHTYAAFLRLLGVNGARWLDLGCGHGVVPEWTGQQDEFSPTIGVDPDRASVARHQTARWRVCGDGEAIPVVSSSVDVVTANMVLEHLANPLAVFAEIARVLRPGGYCVLLTPDTGGYTTRLARLVPEALKAPLARLLHGRHESDVYPALYRANDAGTLQRLGAVVGLDVAVRPIPTGPQLARVPVLRSIEALYIRWRAPRPVLLAVGVKDGGR